MGLRFGLCFAVAYLAVCASGALAAPMPKRLGRFFEQPARSLKTTPKGFRIIALSHLAETVASQWATGQLETRAAEAHLDTLLRVAQSDILEPSGWSITRAGRYGLYSAHLLLVAAAHEVVTGSRKSSTAKLAEALASAAQRRGLGDLPSYPGTKSRWPADQAAALYALFAFERVRGGDLDETLSATWFELLESRGRSEIAGLPVSELVGTSPQSALPRGCATSFLIRYIAPIDRSRARLLWRAYRRNFEKRVLGLTGFREWPPGREYPPDVDSGPIVWDVGAAATGLALVTSRVLGDDVTHRRLEATRGLVYHLADDALLDTASTMLAKSIEALGRTWVPWFEAGGARD